MPKIAPHAVSDKVIKDMVAIDKETENERWQKKLPECNLLLGKKTPNQKGGQSRKGEMY
jgi:hypothetical protein